jgi:hypothetical protein
MWAEGMDWHPARLDDFNQVEIDQHLLPRYVSNRYRGRLHIDMDKTVDESDGKVSS